MNKIALALMMCVAGQSVHALDASNADAHPCGNPFRNHYGPFDYRSATSESKVMVERIHFTPGIEMMNKPGTTTMRNMAQDVAYTLHVFPNHHRALITFARLAERHQSDPPPGASRTVECYFDRAVRFRPDDTVARLLYVQYLDKKQRRTDALNQLELAAASVKDNPLTHYNLGLMYLDLGVPEKALHHAHQAQALGWPKTDLMDRLKAGGNWRDPTE